MPRRASLKDSSARLGRTGPFPSATPPKMELLTGKPWEAGHLSPGRSTGKCSGLFNAAGMIPAAFERQVEPSLAHACWYVDGITHPGLGDGT